MKKVFSNSTDVIHLFAQKSQYEAKSSNVFFYGNKIYSYGYHYLLAEFLDNNTILINDKGYSNTTAKHIRQISYGTTQYKQFFVTETDEKILSLEFKSLINKLLKAKKPELYINKINYLYSKYLEFQEYKKIKPNKELTNFYKIANNNLDLDKYNKAIQLKEKREQAKNLKIFKTDYKDFMNYGIDTIWKRLTNFDYLRVSKCNEFVETSQGLKIDIKEAKKLAFAIESKLSIIGYKIAYYTVKSIDKKQLVIGCHNFKIETVNEMINKLKTI